MFRFRSKIIFNYMLSYELKYITLYNIIYKYIGNQ